MCAPLRSGVVGDPPPRPASSFLSYRIIFLYFFHFFSFLFLPSAPLSFLISSPSLPLLFLFISSACFLPFFSISSHSPFFFLFFYFFPHTPLRSLLVCQLFFSPSLLFYNFFSRHSLQLGISIPFVHRYCFSVFITFLFSCRITFIMFPSLSFVSLLTHFFSFPSLYPTSLFPLIVILSPFCHVSFPFIFLFAHTYFPSLPFPLSSLFL